MTFSSTAPSQSLSRAVADFIGAGEAGCHRVVAVVGRALAGARSRVAVAVCVGGQAVVGHAVAVVVQAVAELGAGGRRRKRVGVVAIAFAFGQAVAIVVLLLHADEAVAVVVDAVADLRVAGEAVGVGVVAVLTDQDAVAIDIEFLGLVGGAVDGGTDQLVHDAREEAAVAGHTVEVAGAVEGQVGELFARVAHARRDAVTGSKVASSRPPPGFAGFLQTM